MTAPVRPISVLIRCHDQGRFLGEAVASLVAQSRPPDEVVIVDDGSSDGSADLARRLLDAGPLQGVVHSRRPARGAVATANDAVLASHGDLLVLLDADDRLSSTYLADLERALASSGADFAYAGARLFGGIEMELPVVPFTPSELRCENFVNISAMFHRRLFDTVGGFKSSFEEIASEDWDFWMSAVEHGMTGVAVSSCWLEYRRSPGSRSVQTRREVLRAHVAMLRAHPTVGLRDVVRWAARAVWRTLRGRSAVVRRAGVASVKQA